MVRRWATRRYKLCQTQIRKSWLDLSSILPVTIEREQSGTVILHPRPPPVLNSVQQPDHDPQEEIQFPPADTYQLYASVCLLEGGVMDPFGWSLYHIEEIISKIGCIRERHDITSNTVLLTGIMSLLTFLAD